MWLHLQTVQRITQTAIASLSDGSVAAADNAGSIASVLQLNATDNDMLASCVEAIAMSDGGTEVSERNWSALVRIGLHWSTHAPIPPPTAPFVDGAG